MNLQFIRIEDLVETEGPTSQTWERGMYLRKHKIPTHTHTRMHLNTVRVLERRLNPRKSSV